MGRQFKHQKNRIEERQALIAQLMLAGYTKAQVVEYGRTHGLTEDTCRRDYDSISQKWSKQSEEELQTARAQAIQRIRGDLARMRVTIASDKPKKGKPKPPVEQNEFDAATYKDIVAHERLLAQIEGTLRPVEVKVSVGDVSRRALIDVINGLSPEEMNSFIAEQKDLEARARG